MSKIKAFDSDDSADLRLACFMEAYRHSGYSPKQLIEIVSKLPGGEKAIINKAFLLTIA